MITMIQKHAIVRIKIITIDVLEGTNDETECRMISMEPL